MIRQIDITKCRIEFLKQFDYYVRNIIGDDDITENWLRWVGLPDDYDETDLKEIALDDELWIDCVNCFSCCCKAAGLFKSLAPIKSLHYANCGDPRRALSARRGQNFHYIILPAFLSSDFLKKFLQKFFLKFVQLVYANFASYTRLI